MVAVNSVAAENVIRAQRLFSGYWLFHVVFWSNACDLMVKIWTLQLQASCSGSRKKEEEKKYHQLSVPFY